MFVLFIPLPFIFSKNLGGGIILSYHRALLIRLELNYNSFPTCCGLFKEKEEEEEELLFPFHRISTALGLGLSKWNVMNRLVGQLNRAKRFIPNAAACVSTSGTERHNWLCGRVCVCVCLKERTKGYRPTVCVLSISPRPNILHALDKFILYIFYYITYITWGGGGGGGRRRRRRNKKCIFHPQLRIYLNNPALAAAVYNRRLYDNLWTKE